MEQKNNDKTPSINVVIVGSSKFDDRGFVFGVLDTFKAGFSNLYQGLKVNNVYSSGYTEIANYAKEWAQLNGAEFQLHNFYAEGKDNPLFENLELPDAILKNDPFFIKGKDFIMSKNINMVITLPNPEGELGPRTHHIANMARLAGVPVMPANELYKQILQAREEVYAQEHAQEQAKQAQLEISGAKNQDGVTSLGKLGKI